MPRHSASRRLRVAIETKLGTVRGHIGSTVTTTVLASVTGGLAYGEITTTNTVAGTNITGTQSTNVYADVFTLTPVAGSASGRR